LSDTSHSELYLDALRPTHKLSAANQRNFTLNFYHPFEPIACCIINLNSRKNAAVAMAPLSLHCSPCLPTEENSIVNISNQIRQSTSFPNNQCLKYLGDSYSQCTEEYSGNMHAHRSNNTIISIPSDTQSSSSSSSSSSEHRPVHMTSAVQPIHFASVPRPMCQH